MTDRECIAMAYGALTAQCPDSHITVLVRNHFRSFGETKSECVPAEKEIEEHPGKPVMAPIVSPRPITEELPATPGDYRLKRSALGMRSTKLIDLPISKLEKSLASYEKVILSGVPVHPEAMQDIEAARIFLGKTTT